MDAQIRAANAAEQQILPAWVAAILSAVGTLLIVWTLLETRRGNAIARREYGKARLEAKRSADHAESALAIARETAASQLRPYLQFTDSKEGDPKFQRGEKIPFAFQNFGQTPAENVELDWCWQIVKRPIGNREISNFMARQKLGDIAPGQQVVSYMNIDFDPAEVAKIASGDVLLLRMRLHYAWGRGGMSCHDLTWGLSNDGYDPWKLGRMTTYERERT